jgi:hypothetical protein
MVGLHPTSRILDVAEVRAHTASMSRASLSFCCWQYQLHHPLSLSVDTPLMTVGATASNTVAAQTIEGSVRFAGVTANIPSLSRGRLAENLNVESGPRIERGKDPSQHAAREPCSFQFTHTLSIRSMYCSTTSAARAPRAGSWRATCRQSAAPAPR